MTDFDKCFARLTNFKHKMTFVKVMGKISTLKCFENKHFGASISFSLPWLPHISFRVDILQAYKTFCQSLPKNQNYFLNFLLLFWILLFNRVHLRSEADITRPFKTHNYDVSISMIGEIIWWDGNAVELWPAFSKTKEWRHGLLADSTKHRPNINSWDDSFHCH